MRKYAMIARLCLQNAIVYRGNLLSGLCFYALFIYVFFCLWSAIYQGGEVAGYNLQQVVWYLCFTEMIVFGSGRQVFNQMNEDIKSGAIAYQLNRPYHYVLYQFSYSLGDTLFRLGLYGGMAVLMGCFTVGPLQGFQWWHAPWMIMSVLLGIFLQFFLHMALGLTAFRLEDNTGFYLIYQKLVFMLGMFIPLEFLPDWLQPVARMLPFSYVAWAPSRLLVSFSWTHFWQVVPLQAAWLAAAVILCMIMYRAGVKGIHAHGG